LRRGWALALFGGALLLFLTTFWWLAADPERGRPPGEAEGAAPKPRLHGSAQRAPDAKRAVEDPAGLPLRVVGGVLVDPELGPLAAGRVDVWCDDGHLVERVQVDEEGRFVARACTGVTCARLTHPAFEQPEAWALEPGSLPELEVVSAPSVIGYVRSSSEEPVANASLLVRSSDGRRATARSDLDGAFAVSLPGVRPCDPCDRRTMTPECREERGHASPGHAQLLVTAPGFAPLEIEVALDGGEELELHLPSPAAPIRGRVLGREGAPFGSRTVVLATNLEREAEQHAAKVDARGEFELGELAEASYRLRAVRDGRELATLDTAAPGDDVELRADIPARYVDLKLELRDGEGQPVVGAQLDGGPLRGAVSDASGRVEAVDVLPGNYTLRVRAADCPAVRVEIELAPAAQLPEIVVLPQECG
jgi:hypothetical protein